MANFNAGPIMGLRLSAQLTENDYEQAVQFARAGGELRVAALMSELGDVGYNAAVSLMERMEDEGIVSRCNAVGKRKLLKPT